MFSSLPVLAVVLSLSATTARAADTSAGGLDLAALQAGSAAAVSGAPSPEPQVLLGGSTATVVAGDPAVIQLTVFVPPGFHVYRDMLKVDVAQAGDLLLGVPSLPPGLQAPDPASPGAMRELYEFDAIVEVPVLRPPPLGTHRVTLDVRYQACHDGICLMPRTEQVQSELIVLAP